MNEDQENQLPELDSHWNYRIIRKESEHEIMGKWVRFGIHEVYYSDGKPSMCSVDAMEPHGETLDELKEDLKHFLAALDKPVLNYEDF